MYNLVNLFVKPSGFIQTAITGLLCLVLAVSVYYLYAAPLLLIVLLFVLSIYTFKLYRRQFTFQRSRQWQLKHGKLYLLNNRDDSSAMQVRVCSVQVWRSMVLFAYQLNGRKYQEIISSDAVDQEAFRQFRCMIKQLQF